MVEMDAGKVSALSTNSSTVSTTVTSTLSSDADNQSTSQFNPQVVGREFVRQYYTVLHNGPHILYRFYSDDSTLLHGGSSASGQSTDPVCGQEDICSKIMSLNFKNCHTKIRQVDSLETMNKGVVIQVIGELSNDSGPMRRFFQTFVLTPRSPTNYYVRTDIFRYQDEIFVEDDEYSESERDESNGGKLENEETHFTTASEAYEPKVSNSGQGAASFDLPINVNGEVNGVSDIERGLANETDTPIEKNMEGLVINSNENTNDGFIKSADDGFDQKERISNERPIGMSTVTDETNTECNNDDGANVNEPKTYANMVSAKSRGPGYTSSPFPSVPSTNLPVKSDNNLAAPFAKSKDLDTNSPPSVTGSSSSVNNTVANNVSTNMRRPPLGHNREPKSRSKGNSGQIRNRQANPQDMAQSDNDSTHGDSSEYAGKRQQSFSDDQQVFVGNLLQNITEDELRKHFGEFGNIIDVRINRTNQRSGKTPNYGFVTFDDASVVKKIIDQKPIFFNNHRFNVEEKRSQSNRGNGGNTNRSSSGVIGGGSSRIINNSGNVNSNGRSQPGGGRRGNDRNDRWVDRSERTDKWNERGGGGGGGSSNERMGESGRRSGSGEKNINRNAPNYQRR